MSPPRLLRVRCARWEQVESFLRKKLRADGRLSMKVPFDAGPGATVTLAIELPNQIVVALDGVMAVAGPADRGDAAVVQLTGARAAIARLEAMLDDARVRGDGGDLAATLAAREAELRRLRQQAAHEVLGCGRGPSPDELRAAWRQRVRREHPDLVARYRSAALRLTAEEAMIHVARAYERLRANVVAANQAVIAGTTLRSIGAVAIETAPSDGFEVVPLTPPVDDTVEATVVDAAVMTRPRPLRTSTPPRPALAATTPPPLDRAAIAPPSEPSSIGPEPLRFDAPAPALTLELDPAAPAPALALELDLPAPPRRIATTRPPATAAAAGGATIEQSLRQARSGPGDRFVRAIRDRLIAGDHAGAAQLASAASQVYPRDRRLAALVEMAAALAAVSRHDRAAAVAATRASLILDPDGAEARRVLAALEQGAGLELDLIAEAYR